MQKKLVSIIINCYNGEKYLFQTLKAILSQTYKEYEVIFIDNCSEDSSAKIFKKIKDVRFKYFKLRKKKTLYSARNFALKKCKGTFITFLDADDWWDKNFLYFRKSFFNSSSKYGFCYSNCYHFFEKKKKYFPFTNSKLPHGFVLNELLSFYSVKMGTIIVKKKLFSKYQFNPRYNIIGDFDFIIRVSKHFKAMSFQDKLVNIRIHEDNMTHTNRKKFYTEFKYWIKKQDFNNLYFKKNKKNLFQKLEYLELIYLVLEKKKLKLFFRIIKFEKFKKKIKLLLILFVPKFILNYYIKHF
jgi:glycosyltransferase involved in cell wall biosynthesis